MKNLILLLILICVAVSSLYSQVCDPAPSHISVTGSTTFCEGGVVLLTSTIGSGIWYKNGVMISPIPSSDYRAKATGYYNVEVEFGPNCKSDTNGTGVVVTVTPKPKSNITANGSTTFCVGGSVMLSSSSASGNQWYKNGQPIGDGGQPYLATSSGLYNVIYYISVGCESDSTGQGVMVSVQQGPVSKITADGPTSFCPGGSVTLTSSSASGNQWYKNGAIIPGATAQDLFVNTQGHYNLIVNNGTCLSDSNGKGTFIFVVSAPKPSIKQIGDSLISSMANSYQWNLEGTPIPNAKKRSLFFEKAGSYSVTVQDNGCSNTSEIFKAIPTEVLFAEKTKVILYPNPVNDLLTISSSQIFNLKIYDNISRKLIETEIFEGLTSVDLLKLNPGIYFLILQNETNFYSQKIEKK